MFPLPAQFPNANLNTGVFGEGRNLLVHRSERRLWPRRSEDRQRSTPGPRRKERGPYGIAATPSGDVWYVSLAGNYLAKVDPVSGAATNDRSADTGRGPRRVWSDSKGMLWVSLWNAGALGRYDPVAKSWKTYPLPKSTGGCYSVYVDDKDRVWVTDWLENAIQMFDPATEKFTAYQSDKRSANVRQMNGRPGEAWGGESGTDRLVVVRD